MSVLGFRGSRDSGSAFVGFRVSGFGYSIETPTTIPYHEGLGLRVYGPKLFLGLTVLIKTFGFMGLMFQVCAFGFQGLRRVVRIQALGPNPALHHRLDLKPEALTMKV